MANRANVKQPAAVLAASYALCFMALCLIIYVLKLGSNILIPFVVAVFVWYLINAIARYYGTFRVGFFKDGKLPSALRFVLAFITFMCLMWFIYELVHQNIDDVIAQAPKYQQSFNKFVPRLAELLGFDHTPTVKELFSQTIKEYIDIGAFITGFAGMLTGMAGKTLVVMFYLGFLLYEQRFFNRKIVLMIKDKATEDRVRNVIHTIDLKVQKYIGVKAFVSACDSFLTFVILSLIGVDFAGFWGVMAFFLHFIPYAGSFVALAMPSIIALIQFGDVSMGFLTLACLGVSHAFLGHILDPYLMGNNLNLSPIIIISNLAMWGMIWGIPGMFLAIPILAIVAIALGQFERTRGLAIFISKTGVIDRAAAGNRRKFLRRKKEQA